MDNQSYLDQFERRVIRSLPDDIKKSLTDQQLKTLLRAVVPVPSHHALALRASFRGIERRYYIALLCGEERRSAERLSAEGQVDAIPVGITFFILLAVAAIYGLFPLVIIGYMIKTMLGIDFLDGPSFVHTMVCG
jgi:nitroreductase